MEKFNAMISIYNKQEDSYGVMNNGRGFVMSKDDWLKLRKSMDNFYENTNVEEHNNRVEEEMYEEIKRYEDTPREKEKPKPKHIYFIRNEEGLTKIGITVNVKKRLAGIQTSNPSKLNLFYSVLSNTPELHESQLHERFKEFKVSGEWFDIPEVHLDDVKKQIEGLIKNGRI